MHHVFVSAVSTTTNKDARIAQMSAVIASGFGPYRKQSIERTYTETNTNPKLLSDFFEFLPLQPYVLVSHTEVTRALIRKEIESTGLQQQSAVFASRSWIDVHCLAWPLLVSGQVAKRDIETLSKHFDIPLGTDSDTADIVTAMLQIYGSIMRRYSTALKGEGIVREVGGPTLAGLRQIIGF